ncbi:MAG TPA: hypothetical protein VHQ86_00360 [Candidatus Saccharimonadia bacterium]|jgi:hypothetical protein|nr:hypothetical protein [Candidatus Saccharimonadia bacterium]
MIPTFLAGITVTCAEINACPNKTHDISLAFANIVQVLLTLIGLLSVIFLIIGALWITMSGGNASRIQRGKDAVRYAVIGIVLAMVSYGVVTYIAQSVK